MHPTKRSEAIAMIKDFGYIEVTVLENGKMSDEIQCTHIEEIEQLVSVYGAENVYF